MRKAQVDPFLISTAELSAPSLLWDFGKAHVHKNRDKCLRFTIPALAFGKMKKKNV